MSEATTEQPVIETTDVGNVEIEEAAEIAAAAALVIKQESEEIHISHKLESEHDISQQNHHDTSAEDATSALIAEATAAAIEAVTGSEDAVNEAVNEAVNAAALAATNEAVNAAALAATDAAFMAENADIAETQEIEPAKEVDAQTKKRAREKGADTGKRAAKQSKKDMNHEDQLLARRMKDRQRYANMTAEQRRIYNAKRREQYHRQNENSRQKRRERERNRYHSLTTDKAKDRNARRAKLERERYQKLTPEELEAKNRRRRERAALARQRKDGDKGSASVTSSVATSKADASMPLVEGQKQAIDENIGKDITTGVESVPILAQDGKDAIITPILAQDGNDVTTTPILAQEEHNVATAPVLAQEDKVEDPIVAAAIAVVDSSIPLQAESKTELVIPLGGPLMTGTEV